MGFWRVYVLLVCLPYIQPFWSDFTHRCLSASRSDDDAPTPRAALDSPTATPLLREWTKATLARHSWKDALATAASVSIFFYFGTPRRIDTDGLQFTLPRVTIRRVMCEHLEATDREMDAIECFHEMMNKSGRGVYRSEPMIEWVSGEFMFYLFVRHTFNLSGQISPIDVSLLPGATMAHQPLALLSIRRPPHHF